MTTPKNYIQAFAVLRVDDYPSDLASSDSDLEIDGVIQHCAGPSNVNVKQVVMSAQEARDEVMRLNQINESKGCKYYWQATHVFLNGGSHGSKSRESENSDG